MAIPRNRNEDMMDAMMYANAYRSTGLFVGFDPAEAKKPVPTTLTVVAVESEILEEFSKLYPNGNRSARDKKIESMMERAVYFEEQRAAKVLEKLDYKHECLKKAEISRERHLHRLAKTSLNPPRPAVRRTVGGNPRPKHSEAFCIASSLKAVQRRIEICRKEIADLERERDGAAADD